MYFDTHAHYDSKAFDGVREELLAAMPEASRKTESFVDSSPSTTSRLKLLLIAR